MREITVYVIEFSDRRYYMMQWRDPLSGRKKTRSTKVERTGRKAQRTEAERVAAKFEADLREGRYSSSSRMSWDAFKDRYDAEKLSSLSAATDQATYTAFGHLERVLNPQRLSDLTTDSLSRFQAELRQQGMKPPTMACHLRHIRAALGWAARRGIINTVPKIERPRLPKGDAMRGRPITGVVSRCYQKRRAGDSNPQPLAGHLISSPPQRSKHHRKTLQTPRNWQ